MLTNHELEVTRAVLDICRKFNGYFQQKSFRVARRQEDGASRYACFMFFSHQFQ